MRGDVALALDIGGGHVTAAVIRLQDAAQGRALASEPVHVAADPYASAPALLGLWADAALRAAATGPAPESIGVAMPSPFEYATGVSRMTHKFAALYGVNVAQALRERWRGTVLDGLPLRFGNDAGLFALGEWWGGAAHGAERMIGVTLGTGLGAGFVAAGQVITSGPQVPPGGELWNLPYLGGVAEDAVSGRAVSRSYQLRGGPPLGAEGVALLADQGDGRARAAYADVGHHLGKVLSPWIATFRPEVLVVGGNVSRAWAHLLRPLEAALPGLTCRPTRRFEQSSLIGAALLGTTAISGAAASCRSGAPVHE